MPDFNPSTARKAPPPSRAKAQSDIMVGTRVHDPEREAKGRRDLAEAKLADYIQKTLDKAPALTADQVDNLVTLLRKHRPAMLAKRTGRAR